MQLRLVWIQKGEKRLQLPVLFLSFALLESLKVKEVACRIKLLPYTYAYSVYLHSSLINTVKPQLNIPTLSGNVTMYFVGWQCPMALLTNVHLWDGNFGRAAKRSNIASQHLLDVRLHIIQHHSNQYRWHCWKVACEAEDGFDGKLVRTWVAKPQKHMAKPRETIASFPFPSVRGGSIDNFKNCNFNLLEA